MKLLLTSAYDVHPGLDTLLASARHDSIKSHLLCADPQAADAIVFIENTQFDDVMFDTLLRHEYIDRHSHKVYMYNEMDRPWNVLPGLYTCMPDRSFAPEYQQAFAYLSTPNPYLSSVFHDNPDRRFLYSFMGAMSHACRKRIMRLPREHAYLQDTSDFNVWNTDKDELETRARQYAQIVGASSFILCPRGIGTSSIRLYETLEAGRVPVIISDQWTPPPETDWNFAVRIKEKQIGELPALMESLQNEARHRGEAARAAWLDHYSPDTLFNTLGNAVQALQRRAPERATRSPRPSNRLPINKWVASGGLYARTAIQRLRGER